MSGGGIVHSNYALGVYPMSLSTGPYRTYNDFVISGDAAFTVGPTKTSIGVGAFYFNHGGQDALELHVNGFISKSWGLQVGYLTSVQHSPEAWDTFVVYRTGVPFTKIALEAGAGFYMNGAAGGSTNVTGYLHASYPIVKRLSLDGTYWYIGNAGFSVNRLAIGAALHF
jgi:hypothetical protein